MRSKKFLVSAFLLAGVLCLVLLQSSAPPPPVLPEVPDFEQQPPIVKHAWVKKKMPPSPTGENLVMKIEYEPDSRLTDSLAIYYNTGVYIWFHDDGIGPDVTANDYIYSAYLADNISAFRSQMIARDAQLTSAGGYSTFTGHVGGYEAFESGSLFDVSQFDAGNEVSVGAGSVHLTMDCGDNLLKQNSLFITDLDVVEDPARTFNIVANGGLGSGNPNGVWTFGNLIKNMAHEQYSTVSAKEFLKVWLKRWAYGDTLNDQTIPARTRVFNHLIGPWIQKASKHNLVAKYGQTNADEYYLNVSDRVADNWEADWDDANEDTLLMYAPFKLTAIVNRIDLRGNLAYVAASSNAGEIRFIYSLIAPFDMSFGGIVPDVAAGMPPIGGDGHLSSGCASALDWQGMNIILEYGIPITSRCALREYAHDWLDLSVLSLGSGAYNSALEALTHVVIDSGAAPLREDNNKSAVDQVRTNERIFFESRCGSILLESEWKASDWELSQFEILGGYLKPAPVTNTPMNNSNAAAKLTVGTDTYDTHYSASGRGALVEWLFWQKTQVLQGNYKMPRRFIYSGDTVRMAATAIVDAEAQHYWDLYWDIGTTTHFSGVGSGYGYETEKNVRLQFALNTCQGCHAGEAKTLFTMMRPLGYGQAANYWTNSDTPDYDLRAVDSRTDFASTTGFSHLNGTAEPNYTHLGNNSVPATVYNARVAPFLTGRSFTGTGTYQDDWQNGSEDLNDPAFNFPNTFYFVFEPTNDGSSTYPKGLTGIDERFNRFNDLERRRIDLCNFINSQCGTSPKVIEILEGTDFTPLPKGGH